MSMYLYHKDYSLLGQQYFDFMTTNTSFLKMYRILSRMGIKNNKFFLVITQPELIGVNPHADNLTEEQMLKIAYECKVNPWYIFRSMMRIPETGGASPYKLSRANLALTWSILNCVDIMLVMPRQLGKTIGSIGITAAIIYALGFHTKMAMLAKDDGLRRENVDRLKDIRDHFPKWFINKSIKDSDNSEGISYTALNNKYLTFVAQKSKVGAEGLGRGMTLGLQHWDEVAYFANIDISYPVAVNSTIAAIKSSKANNQLYGNMLTTTAGELNTKHGRYAHKLACSSLPFTERLYDCNNREELLELVADNSRQGMLFAEYNHLQLGEGEDWLVNAANRSAGETDVVDRDLKNIWTRGGGKNDAVDIKYLNRMHDTKRDPDWVEVIDNFMIRWYIPKSIVQGEGIKNIPIVIGTDSSENIGKDFTTLVFMDARNMEVIGVCSCNTVNIIRVALFIATFLYKENYLFIPERNSTGTAIIDAIIIELEKRNINPFRKIFNFVIQDREKYSNVNYHNTNTVNDNRKLFGYRTTGGRKGRSFLYNAVFFKALDHGAEKINDSTIVNEISGLVEKNGRIDHSENGHDDHVIAYILCAFVLFWGKNLQLYDFLKKDPSKLLCDLRTDAVMADSSENITVKDTVEKIANIQASLNKETNPTLRIRMLHRLKDYERSLPKDHKVTVDDVVSITELEKKKKPMQGVNNTDAELVNFFRS